MCGNASDNIVIERAAFCTEKLAPFRALLGSAQSTGAVLAYRPVTKHAGPRRRAAWRSLQFPIILRIAVCEPYGSRERRRGTCRRR